MRLTILNFVNFVTRTHGKPHISALEQDIINRYITKTQNTLKNIVAKLQGSKS